MKHRHSGRRRWESRSFAWKKPNLTLYWFDQWVTWYWSDLMWGASSQLVVLNHTIDGTWNNRWRRWSKPPRPSWSPYAGCSSVFQNTLGEHGLLSYSSRLARLWSESKRAQRRRRSRRAIEIRRAASSFSGRFRATSQEKYRPGSLKKRNH